MNDIGKALILGGTRYVGKRLVANLMDLGYSVTIATRGRASDPFGKLIKRVIIDRFDKESMSSTLGKENWDVVYDQLCFSSRDAADICEVFSDKTNRYIFSSSQAVYSESGHNISEYVFDPYNYPVKMGRRTDFSYEEGKRQAEAYMFQNADFPVSALRFPIILGPDDYTRRLHIHVENVLHDKPLLIKNGDVYMSLISSTEAADCLAWVSTSDIAGPINACSWGEISVYEIIEKIGKAVEKEPQVEIGDPDDPFSLFAMDKTQTLNTIKAADAGFHFLGLYEWFTDLITEIAMSSGFKRD